MKYFRLRPCSNSRFNNSLETKREYNLPGVICNSCGQTWGRTGVIYPAFSLPSELDESDYRSRWPVPIDRFRNLSGPLEAAWDSELPVGPGLEFGKSIGKAYGKFGDFAWKTNWCAFISKCALCRLHQKGFSISIGEPEIFQHVGRFDYSELHIDAFVAD